VSGGSMEYLYGKVSDVARNLERSRDPLRRAFAKHLYDVSRALHDIEWVDSCDYSPGDEGAAIRKCLQPDADLAVVVADAKECIKRLQALLKKRK